MKGSGSLAILAGLVLLAISRSSRGASSPASEPSPTPEPTGPLSSADELAAYLRELETAGPAPLAPSAPAPGVSPPPARENPGQTRPLPPQLPPAPSSDPHAPWSPDATTRAIGEAIRRDRAVPWVQGSPLDTDDLSLAQLPVQPGVRELARYIATNTAIRSGTARGRSVQRPALRADGTLRRRDVHEEGRALDAMTSNIERGTLLANWLVRHARELGIQQVLWRNSAWSSDPRGRSAWSALSGHPHEDHVHVELTPTTAADGPALARILAGIAYP